ncbi:MAG: Gfo/Idh/MocA family oxidoreductase [Planctomycetota bacterium]|jgi:hypothetical protein
METQSCSRRDFIRSTTALGLGVMAGCTPRPVSTRPSTDLRVLSIGVIGTIGGTDRQQVHEHPLAEIVGLCDVDANALEQAAQDHPDAFTCADYREAFDKHGDAFDAVIVATPDHSHCSIMTLALARSSSWRSWRSWAGPSRPVRAWSRRPARSGSSPRPAAPRWTSSGAAPWAR